MRELAVLAPPLARRYVSLVAAVAPRVESRLLASVLANRVARSSVRPPVLRLGPWRAERAAFASALGALGRQSPWVVFADVRDCYGSIAPPVVMDSLGALGCDSSATESVGAFLLRLARRGARGLPVGPAPSAVLANAVLARADDALRRVGVAHLRWVDDVVAAARDPEDAVRILDLLRRSLAGLGLELNASKTRILAGPAALGAARASMTGGPALVG